VTNNAAEGHEVQLIKITLGKLKTTLSSHEAASPATTQCSTTQTSARTTADSLWFPLLGSFSSLSQTEGTSYEDITTHWTMKSR
jgi:hypothetical protein